MKVMHGDDSFDLEERAPDVIQVEVRWSGLE